MKLVICTLWLVFAGFSASAQSGEKAGGQKDDDKVQAVINELDKLCREGGVPMLGPEKAKRLAELVRKAKPRKVVECGTALGYSGLWIARELKNAGGGELVTIEISAERAKRAEGFFRKAGLSEFVTVKVGDARQVAKEIKGPVDFVFIDCGFANYLPCLKGLQKELAPGATIVADNAGIGAAGMKDYLEEVRSKYK
ncbi:MAG: class I SAM-dependent methyltransferase, partial [Candidatus Nealsonbacteria bacterium]|nr:class I SAM-dependent methyltransferase [Candidatus Nealsonbacteria bacterium]